jgi:hypothetical protein
MNQTRRLAATLAADAARYSRLIGADEGSALERLKHIREEKGMPQGPRLSRAGSMMLQPRTMSCRWTHAFSAAGLV